jgi:hypothetical protein
MARIYLAFAIIVLDVGYLCEFGSYFNFNGVFGTTSSAYFSNAPSLFGDLYYSPFLGMGFIFFHVLLTLLFLAGLRSLSFCFLFFMTTLSIQNYMLSHNIASGADTFTAQILFWFLLTQ